MSVIGEICAGQGELIGWLESSPFIGRQIMVDRTCSTPTLPDASYSSGKSLRDTHFLKDFVACRRPELICKLQYKVSEVVKLHFFSNGRSILRASLNVQASAHSRKGEIIARRH